MKRGIEIRLFHRRCVVKWRFTFSSSNLSLAGMVTKVGVYNGLVISLPIGNALIKRILIDNGSSANVLFLEALQEMGLDEKSIIRRSTVLVGFSGESLRTVGEISLPTYAEGVNVMTKFNVVDCPSAYNVILGRPWIHKMKAMPSTYHQSIKFPTKWGVMEIKGQQRDAKKCYETALKPSKSSI